MNILNMKYLTFIKGNKVLNYYLFYWFADFLDMLLENFLKIWMFKILEIFSKKPHSTLVHTSPSSSTLNLAPQKGARSKMPVLTVWICCYVLGECINVSALYPRMDQLAFRKYDSMEKVNLNLSTVWIVNCWNVSIQCWGIQISIISGNRDPYRWLKQLQ